MVSYLDSDGVKYLITQIRDKFWPVGSILATSNDTSPASYLGGSWETFGAGQTLVGIDTTSTDKFKTLLETGGNKTLDIGRKTDLATSFSIDAQARIWFLWNDRNEFSAPAKWESRSYFEGSGNGIQWNGGYHTFNGGKVFGTLDMTQPYITVHYWRRIS